MVVTIYVLHNFIRIHEREDESFFFFLSILLLLSFLYLATKYCYYCYNL